MAFRKAWKDGNRTAYDSADSLAEAAEAYKRCRTPKYFILSPSGVEAENPQCGGCGRNLLDDPADLEGYKGNRCIFYPRTKTVSVRHYTCAWGDTLSAVAAIRV